MTIDIDPLETQEMGSGLSDRNDTGVRPSYPIRLRSS